jgi:prolyl 4-hydroxylase
MIQEYSNFISPEECETLISLGESGQLNVGTTNGQLLGYRKAKVRWFSDHPLIESVTKRISEISNTELSKQEPFHFVKYEPNGEYKSHYDGAHRCKTALLYLNNSYTGGQTYFPKIDRKIIPEIGKLIIWDNIDKNGNLDIESYHAGLPVEFGTKYIAVIWIKK